MGTKYLGRNNIELDIMNNHCRKLNKKFKHNPACNFWLIQLGDGPISPLWTPKGKLQFHKFLEVIHKCFKHGKRRKNSEPSTIVFKDGNMCDSKPASLLFAKKSKYCRVQQIRVGGVGKLY